MTIRTGARLLTFLVYGVLFSLIGIPLIVKSASGSEPRGMVYKFGAVWCGPCQRVAPVVDKLHREGLAIQSIDIDKQPDVAARFQVDRVPTFVLVVDGKVADRVVGMMTEGELRSMIARIPATPATPDPVAQPNPPTSGTHNDISLGNPSPFPRPNDHPVETQPVEPPAENRGGISGLWPFGRRNEEPPVFRANDPTLGATEAVTVAEVDPMSASIRIRVKQGDSMNLGSGTIVRSRSGINLIITCAHIFRHYTDAGKIEVDVFQNGQSKLYLAKLEKLDEQADVGLISIPTDAPIAEVPVGPVSSAPVEGDQVACIGCSGGSQPTREQLRVTAVNRYDGPHNIECTGIPVQGRSGGGLFNRKGELVGVCSASDKDGQRGVYSGLLAIHALLDQCGLTALYQPPQAAPVRQPEEMLAGPFSPTPPASSAPSASPAASPVSTLANVSAPAQPLDVETGDAEVVVIIKNRKNPGAQDRIVIIHEASPTFLKYLDGELSPGGEVLPAFSQRNPVREDVQPSPDWAIRQPAPLRLESHSTGATNSGTLPPSSRSLRLEPAPLLRSSTLEPTSQETQRYRRSVE